MLGEREFTTEEVAQLCGVSRPTVVEWITRSLLPARLTEGGHRRIPRAALAAFMSAQGYRLPPAVGRAKPLVHAIDDEAMWRAVIESALEPDFEVKTFPRGIEALLACGASRPDVIVLDLRMPGLDGCQMLDALSTEPTLKDTLLVALTTYEEEVPSARRHGAHLAISKNRAGELHGALVRLVTEAQRRQPIAA